MRGKASLQKSAHKKGILWFFILLLLSLNFLIMPYYYAARPLMIGLALLLGGGIYRLCVRGGLDVTFQMTWDRTQPSRMICTVTAVNTSWLPKLFVQIPIKKENLLTGDRESWEIYTVLGPKGRRRIRLEKETPLAGCYRVQVEKAYIGDVLGIFRREIQIEARGEVTIFPPYEAIEAASDVYSTFNMESFHYAPFRTGDDPGEIRGVRDYRPGDRPKHIHWKLSGKLGDIVVRELGYPVENDVLILVDYAQVDDSRAAHEKMVICRSLSARLMEKNIAHHIGWYSKEENRFCLHPVKTMQDQNEVMGKLLRNRMENEEISTVRRFLAGTEANQRAFSHYLYISDDERDEKKLMEYGAVNVFGTKEKRHD